MVDDDGDVAVRGSSWYQRTNAHVAHLQGQLNRFEEQRKADRHGISPDDVKLVAKANAHLAAARKALQGSTILEHITGASADRALANVHEAEVALLRVAPEDELRNKALYALSHARVHLRSDDVCFQQLKNLLFSRERQVLARSRRKELDANGRELAAITLHAAYQAEEAERARVRSFTQIVVMAAVALWVIVIGLGIWGSLDPAVSERFCFPAETGKDANGNPQKACPLGGSEKAASIFFLEFLGMSAAALAGAVSLKIVRGTSGPYHVATGLIILRLPVGALTAVAGILMMSGEFFPGLTRLDTPSQVAAWAFAFGILQESVTRAIDRQGQYLLDNVKGPELGIETKGEKGGGVASRKRARGR
ncbi:hypothetical protein ACWGH2_08990 [Streptomyces sp. NPDC054871]